MEWTVGTVLWTMLVLWFVFAVLWMFVAVFTDIFRRHDLAGWAKVAWIAALIFFPLFGVLAYLLFMRHSPEPALIGYRPAEEIDRAARLHDQGKISSEEFEYLKHQALVR